LATSKNTNSKYNKTEHKTLISEKVHPVRENSPENEYVREKISNGVNPSTFSQALNLLLKKTYDATFTSFFFKPVCISNRSFTPQRVKTALSTNTFY
jgi:hypothetical protein